MNLGKRYLSGWIFRSILLWPLFSTGLFAAGEQPRDAVEAERYTYDYLYLIDALIRNGKYSRAKVELDALLERVKQKPDETALARQAYGYLSIGLKDYATAIDHFLFAVNSGLLPPKITLSLRYTLAQLFYQEERYQEGLKQLQVWFEKSEKPTPESRVLLASLHYALKQYRKAIKPLKQAIEQSDSPRESWYQMLVGLYFETKQFKKSIPVLKLLVKKFPQKPIYWQQLSDVLLQLGNEQKAVAVLSLAAEKNLLDESGLIRLAKLYLQQNNPLDAAELLTARSKSGDIEPSKVNLYLLVDAWLLARDQQRALKVLEKLAEIDKSGKPQLRMGRLYLELEQWQMAQMQLKQGIERSRKPSFDDWLLLGNAYFRLESQAEARSAFESALDMAANEKQHQLARRWIDYLGNL
jgi:tetratricopeptide (TPR) repeat protein